MCPTVSNLYNVYKNNYNSNSLFDIILCLQSVYKQPLVSWIFTMATFKPQLFCSHTTLHKADWILTTGCLSQVVSLMKVLAVERSRLRLLENSICDNILFVYCVHRACGCVGIFVILFLSCTVVVSLLVISSICMFV